MKKLAILFLSISSSITYGISFSKAMELNLREHHPFNRSSSTFKRNLYTLSKNMNAEEMYNLTERLINKERDRMQTEAEQQLNKSDDSYIAVGEASSKLEYLKIARRTSKDYLEASKAFNKLS